MIGSAIGAGATIATFGLAAPIIPAMAGTGALIGAGTGGAVGGTVGYAYDYKKAGTGFYEYHVLTVNNEDVVIRQVDNVPFYVGQTVTITWEKNHRVINPLQTPKNITE